MLRSKNLASLFIGYLVVLAFGAMHIANAAQPPQFSGAIFTSTSDGTTVNLNIYDLRSDVYLNGGPQGGSPNGLPDGTYYFQVTNPSGSLLLSTDPAVCRQLVVSGGVIAGVPGPLSQAATDCANAGGALHAIGTTNPNNGTIPVQLFPFDFTDNNGGEYKAWLIQQTSGTSIDSGNNKVIIFQNSDHKSDNFKVKEQACGQDCELPLGSVIGGVKFYDANVDGIFNNDEVGIPGWKIELFGDTLNNTTSVLTDLTGEYSFLNLAAGTYGVCEVIPQNAPIWVPTTPTSITGILLPPDSTLNDFGNVCLGAGGGKTLGFWSNKNGQALITGGNLCALNAMYLRSANGSDFNPVAGCPTPTASQTSTGKTNLKNWLLKATATNMAYMLSAQLAAMKLNVLSGGVDGGANIFAGTAPAGCTVPGLSTTGFITIGALITAADTASNHALDSDPNTKASGAARSCQEFMKNALDKGNNNLNFVQAEPCEVNYSNQEATCAPLQ